MPSATHIKLAIHLLRDAAGFFCNVGEQNPAMQAQMNDNADVYERVAELIEQDPHGEVQLDEDD
jgi:hypothetical protein